MHRETSLQILAATPSESVGDAQQAVVDNMWTIEAMTALELLEEQTTYSLV